MLIRIAPLITVLLATTQCTSSARPLDPQTPASEPPNASPAQVQESETPVKERSATKDWSEVQPLAASDSGATAKRKSRVVVSSDPGKHGASLHFKFLVNASPISGVFVVPGGQTATFTIPVGTVHFSVDECEEAEPQGFDLAPDEEIPISCKLGKDGDCCEVAIPVDESAETSKPPKKSKR